MASRDTAETTIRAPIPFLNIPNKAAEHPPHVDPGTGIIHVRRPLKADVERHATPLQPLSAVTFRGLLGDRR